LRFGAGIKGKLLEAMQCGTPSVTTGIGAESMQGYLPWMDLLQMIPMFSLRKLFNYIRINRVGFRRKKRYYRTTVSNLLFETEFKLIIDNLQSNLQQHRLNNFMGAVLQHHTLKVPNTCPNGLRKKKIELAFSNLFNKANCFFLFKAIIAIASISISQFYFPVWIHLLRCLLKSQSPRNLVLIFLK
jgi:hypothetical protein